MNHFNFQAARALTHYSRILFQMITMNVAEKIGHHSQILIKL